MNHERFSENFISLKTAARDAPLEPGVYIMRDEESRIIYVGKARVLRNRLVSYFSGEKDIKTRTLIRQAKTIETIIVSNEYEALLLENTLIKQHYPKYNINLKDGKTYPVIRITAETYPRVFRTRHIIEDGSQYFGPFPNIQAVDTILELIDKLFPLRKCRVLRKRDAPCMYFHIDRCSAPCCGKIGAEEYGVHVEEVKKLLTLGGAENSPEKAGGSGAAAESLILDLTQKMHEAARLLQFERAARIRNGIKAIEELSEGVTMVDFDPQGRDYIAWATEGVFTTFTVFSMRGGKMTGRELFRTRSAAEEDESLETFVAAYYTPSRPPPPQIYLASEARLPGKEGEAPENRPPGDSPPLPSYVSLRRWFTDQFSYEPELRILRTRPAGSGGIQEGEKRHAAILAMARQNALEDLRRRLKERGAGPALDELAQVLKLRTRPERIEGFDIAQLDGKHPVASLISFKNGVPDRKQYRYFKLRTVVGVVDDFAAMREAVFRRYSRLIREGAELPDLILIDGGIGQVNAARGILDELGLDCDVVGLAKRDEELWLPRAREPVRLSKRSEALKVLQFVRDETHRFATSFNQRLRSKDLLFTVLESVEGIGPKRAAAIMKVYKELPAIAAADPEDLAERCKLGAAAAKAVRAAARLALEDREGVKKRRIPGNGAAGGGYASPGTEAAFLAAEAAAPDLSTEPGREEPDISPLSPGT
ncbi:MAG: excinuclease ABC subunit UvrC [Treponema sp.]|jgi:excinuclease ABC subunit C|nr:excinuclease ABC subunit UvrC [Treponema sp.]